MLINTKNFTNKFLNKDVFTKENTEISNSVGIIYSPDLTDSYALEKDKGQDITNIHSVESITVKQLNDEKDWEDDPTYMDNSPYSQVRAVVEAADDLTIRVNH